MKSNLRPASYHLSCYELASAARSSHLSLLHYLSISLIALLLSSCTNPFVYPTEIRASLLTSRIKDKNPLLWQSNHALVQKFHRYYNRTNTVKKALVRAQPYLPTIVREFRRRGLPEELAYLPMLESTFKLDANSGSALGMWQFTAQTARHMGLHISHNRDDRLNWKKSTVAAARYLEQLGLEFNYRWELALAAYNGGPNYLSKKIQQQHTTSFFRLRLRQETAEYVPKFIAMLQVAKQKYPKLYAPTEKRYFKLASR